MIRTGGRLGGRATAIGVSPNVVAACQFIAISVGDASSCFRTVGSRGSATSTVISEQSQAQFWNPSSCGRSNLFPKQWGQAPADWRVVESVFWQQVDAKPERVQQQSPPKNIWGTAIATARAPTRTLRAKRDIILTTEESRIGITTLLYRTTQQNAASPRQNAELGYRKIFRQTHLNTARATPAAAPLANICRNECISGAHDRIGSPAQLRPFSLLPNDRGGPATKASPVQPRRCLGKTSGKFSQTGKN